MPINRRRMHRGRSRRKKKRATLTAKRSQSFGCLMDSPTMMQLKEMMIMMKMPTWMIMILMRMSTRVTKTATKWATMMMTMKKSSLRPNLCRTRRCRRKHQPSLCRKHAHKRSKRRIAPRKSARERSFCDEDCRRCVTYELFSTHHLMNTAIFWNQLEVVKSPFVVWMISNVRLHLRLRIVTTPSTVVVASRCRCSMCCFHRRRVSCHLFLIKWGGHMVVIVSVLLHYVARRYSK